MKYFLLYSLLLFSFASVAQEPELSNPIEIRQKQLADSFRHNGSDTVLCYVKWAFDEQLAYYGDGFIAWRKGDQYFIRYMAYDHLKKEIVEEADILLAPKIINSFFTSGQLILSEPISMWSPSYRIDVSMLYGNTSWSTEIRDYELHGKKRNRNLQWILQLDQTLEQHRLDAAEKAQ